MALFQAFNISASGMTAERFRTDIIAENIANVNTTSTESGGPYRRKIVNFAERKVTPFSQYYATASQNPAIGNGVKVTSVKEDTETDFVKEYDPSNPDADADGYVSYPNVNTVTEMTNLIDSTRAYEANATAFDATKSMATTGLSDLREDKSMDITQLSGVSSDYLNTFAKKEALVPGDDDSFSAVLSTAMKSVDETNDLQNTAESEEVRFALGEAENPHDLLIAETKANVALQYTVAVRDKLIDGYKEIMQMSI